jgi:hypothetical protein
MPHVGPVSEGRTYFCPHCGALYSVRPSRLSKTESNTATKCVVCLTITDKWNTTGFRSSGSFNDPKMPDRRQAMPAISINWQRFNRRKSTGRCVRGRHRLV